MDNAWVFVLALFVALLLAMPAVRRWFSSDERRPLVDPEQDITVEQKNSGIDWFSYRLNYRPRRAPRGRRHEAPASPSPNRVRRDPPPS
jgi:hypothetical protein